jgi:hypothetical protein
MLEVAMTQFPSTIWQNIFFFSDGKTVAKISRVCRNARNGAASAFLWTHLFQKQFEYTCLSSDAKAAFGRRFRLMQRFDLKTAFITDIKGKECLLLINDALLYADEGKLRLIEVSAQQQSSSEAWVGQVRCLISLQKLQNYSIHVPSGSYFICITDACTYLFKNNLNKVISKHASSDFLGVVKDHVISICPDGFNLESSSGTDMLACKMDANEYFQTLREKGDKAFILTSKALYIVDVIKKSVVKREEPGILTIYIPLEDTYCLFFKDKIKVYNFDGTLKNSIFRRIFQPFTFDRYQLFISDGKLLRIYDLRDGKVRSMAMRAAAEKLEGIGNRLLVNYNNTLGCEVFNTETCESLNFFEVKCKDNRLVPQFLIDPILNFALINYVSSIDAIGIIIDLQTGKIICSGGPCSVIFENGISVGQCGNTLLLRSSF